MKIDKNIKIGAGIVGSVLLLFVGKKIYSQIKLKHEKNILDTSVATYDIGAIAAEIYDSFYNNDWLGITEDEQRAVNAILPLPNEYVNKLSDTYFKLYNKILKADFVKYLSSEQWNVVKQKFD
jgi:hypothetical protein